tara:strand:+ start:235 stop:678 length:444 start_codon:yes stop_codon:yes gene_type:complete
MVTLAAIKKLQTFAKKLEKASVEVPKKVNKIKQGAAKVGVRKAIYKTRVDTSKARSNWQISIGVEESTKKEAWFKGKGGSTRGPSSDAAYRFAVWDIGKSKAGESIFITNPQDYVANYIEPLDWMTKQARIEIEASLIKKSKSLKVF